MGLFRLIKNKVMGINGMDIKTHVGACKALEPRSYQTFKGLEGGTD